MAVALTASSVAYALSRLRRWVVAPVDRRCGAGGGQSRRDDASDALRGAADERLPAAQVDVHPDIVDGGQCVDGDPGRGATPAARRTPR